MWVLALPGASGQEVLNGTFENTLVNTCGINLFNEVFSDRMAFAFAFGEENELDVLTGACGYGPAPEGDYYVALNADAFVDASSLELTKPLEPGRRYYLQFRQRAGVPTLLSDGVVIGLSDRQDDFGESLYTSGKLSTRWEVFEAELTPTQSGKYLTVRAPRARSWVFVDDFRVTCPPPIDLGPDTTVCNANTLQLELNEKYDTYLWQNGSTAPVLSVGEPGNYSVTVTYHGCSLKDEIRIDEFPANCVCHIYVPNVFSPNNDGVNDVLRVGSGCSFSEFEMAIYDRWGNQVYVDQDPMAGWNGQVSGKSGAKAVYRYVLRYQFEYEKEMAYQTGTILLLPE